MTDDIVTRLRRWSIDLYPAPYGACMEQAADEIERLRGLAKALYEETKRCGSKHDVVATMNWEEYEQDMCDE